MKSLDKLPEQGIDEMEKLAYLIAEEFVRETKIQLTNELIGDPALRCAGESAIIVNQPKIKTAGANG